jgi:hypothetical protein
VIGRSFLSGIGAGRRHCLVSDPARCRGLGSLGWCRHHQGWPGGWSFLAYKERLIDYINRFIADLANSGAQIAVLLSDLEAVGHDRLLELAARREAADAIPEGEDGAESLSRAERQAADSWRNGGAG